MLPINRPAHGTNSMTDASSVGRNTVYLTIASVLSTAVGVAFNIFLARTLGVERFGEFAFAISFIALFSTIVDFSLQTITVRDVARDPGRAAIYFGNSLALKGLLFLIAMLLAAATATVLNYSYGIRLLLAVLMLSLFLDGVRKCCDSLFTAAEKMQFPAAFLVAEKTLFGLLGFAALHFSETVIAVAVAYVVAHGITQVVSLLLLRSRLGVKPNRIEYAFVKSLAQRASPFFGISLIAAMYANIDRLFLFSLDGTVAVGIYAAAYRLVSVPTRVSASFHQAIFPKLSRHAGLPDQATMTAVLESSMRYLTFAAVPLAIGTTALAEPIILLFYGSAYTSGTLALQILIWAYALEFFNPFFSRVLFVVDGQRVVLVTVTVATGINIILNILLIPKLSFVGAAIATLISAGIIFVVLYLGVRQHFPSLSFGGSLLKTIAAGLIMWLVLLLFDGIGVVKLIFTGALVYLISSLIIGAISVEDLAMPRNALGRISSIVGGKIFPKQIGNYLRRHIKCLKP